MILNNLEQFKKFYLEIVLINLTSYKPHFNEDNFDINMQELIKKFQDSYGINPLEVGEPEKISLLLKENKEPFNEYSKRKGTNIPRAILSTHYVNFLKYRTKNEFSNLQNLVDNLHEAFGKFCRTFQEKRISFNGNSKVASNKLIYGDVRNDYWTINKGSEKEIQYHIYKDKNFVGYGLGFNAQKSMNNLDPIKNVSKFIGAFLSNRSLLKDILFDYDFLGKEIEDLININEGDFILYGKRFKIDSSDSFFKLEDLAFLRIYYDLRYKQYVAYKKIFEDSTKTLKPISDLLKTEKMKSLLEYKKQIILQGPPGTGKTREAKFIAAEMLGIDDVDDLKEFSQFKLIQFHPSYTYEDFVRGIVAESKGDKIEYKNVNKTLGLFAEEALRNYKASTNTSTESNIEFWIDSNFEDFKYEIEKEIEENEIILSGDITLFKVESDNFRYGRNWDNPSRINFTDFKNLVKAIIEDKFKFSNQQIPREFSVHAHYRYTYYNALLKIFFEKYNYQGESYSEPSKNYVLIIDEINRANLSSVLGELIYALEYRGKAVESMYNVDGNELILPPNLYIIGTMNTADRSVGHIDYAIRRRFAFVNVHPKNLKVTQGLEGFDDILFNNVADLFETNLSHEFEKKDVQLGHSYFIDKLKDIDGAPMSIRLEYEIKPILLEYVKDGVLIGEDIKQKIEALTPSI
ncbi:AAA family ATPase [Flavobacterium sp. EDS]|uniref:McrB family protein n=1 Tax=Flavobacterium sp. EDS TaxID=2897328 RepID=UPI001E636014|nr:AAA family ATPase [Flavobacterium sp. EDS]MCD0475254.1 AAA family ATPase [Flavobacterium sp. EDS]